MGIKGHCTGVAVALLSLSLGLAGCVTQDNYQPLQYPVLSGCPNCQGPRAMAGAAGTLGAPRAGDGQVVQTAYQEHGDLHDGGPGLVMSEGDIVMGRRRLGGRLGLGDPKAVDSPPAGGNCCPRELTMTSHPPFTVAPPDVLLIDVLRAVPKGPYRLEPMEALQIAVTDTLPNQPIAGSYMISPEGMVNLGFTYGSVRVGGMSLEDAEVAIRKQLAGILKNANVTVGVVQFRGIQQIGGQHLVRPDGTISLGTYGSVYVAGFTLGQVKCEVEKYLSAYLVNPQVSVDILSYNSKKFYVIFDGGGYGQQIFPIPSTGNETVLDAISRVGGLAPVSSTHHIVLARPSPCDMGCNQILPVDWKAVLLGSTCTNYQVFPGDRIYVYANKLIAFDNYLAQVLAPVERIFGIVLLGTTTVQQFRNNGNGNGNGAGFIVAPR
jgi:protein involved in polysaccharide export with SLBB domain